MHGTWELAILKNPDQGSPVTKIYKENQTTTTSFWWKRDTNVQLRLEFAVTDNLNPLKMILQLPLR